MKCLMILFNTLVVKYHYLQQKKKKKKALQAKLAVL